MIYQYNWNYGFQRYKQREQINNSLNEKILNCILDDDDENFSELMIPIISSKTDLNMRFALNDYKIPKILSYWPTYASLCAFFCAEKCFNSLILLCPDGIQNEIFKNEDDYGRSILHFACFGGNLDIIRKLCQAGYDLHAVDKNGYHISHFAAMSGKIDVLKYLLIKGIEIVWNDEKTMLPFHLACYYGNLDMVKFICEKIDTQKVSLTSGYKSKKALHFACDGGHVEILDYLLNNYKIIVKNQINQFDYDSFTPLLYACKKGNLDCVKSLIKFGNVRLNYGNRTFNPFVEASSKGHLDIIRYFLSLKEIDLKASDSKGIRALKAAVNNGHFSIIELLIQHGVINVKDKKQVGDLFIIACENSDIETMEFLDELLTIPYDLMGDSFMTKAIVNENEEIVTFLISKNCNLQNSLPFINFRGKLTKFMSFLKSKGASFTNVILKSGLPVIVEAAKFVNLTNLKKLISEGFELNKEIIEKYDLFSISARAANIDTFQFLMSFEPELNNGEHCFMVVLEKYKNSISIRNQRFKDNCMKIARILLSKYNVNPNDKNILNYSFSNSLISILDLLSEFNANFENHPFNFNVFKNDESLEIINFLQNKNVNLNYLISDNNLPIIVEALQTDNLILINKFIDNGFELNKEIVSQYKIIENVCLKGNVEIFNFLIQYEPELEDKSKILSQIIRKYGSLKHSNNIESYYYYILYKTEEKNESDINNYFKIIECLLNHYHIVPDENIINYTAAFAFIEVLELLLNNSTDLSNCGLDFSRMIESKHMAVFELLKAHGCRFNKNLKFYNESTTTSNFDDIDKDKSPIEINFNNCNHSSYDVNTLLFLVDYSTKEDIMNLRKKKKHFYFYRNPEFIDTIKKLNIIDFLLYNNNYDGILMVYKKIDQILLPQICTLDIFKKKLKENCSEQILSELALI